MLNRQWDWTLAMDDATDAANMGRPSYPIQIVEGDMEAARPLIGRDRLEAYHILADDTDNADGEAPKP